MTYDGSALINKQSFHESHNKNADIFLSTRTCLTAIWSAKKALRKKALVSFLFVPWGTSNRNLKPPAARIRGSSPHRTRLLWGGITRRNLCIRLFLAEWELQCAQNKKMGTVIRFALTGFVSNCYTMLYNIYIYNILLSNIGTCLNQPKARYRNDRVWGCLGHCSNVVGTCFGMLLVLSLWVQNWRGIRCTLVKPIRFSKIRRRIDHQAVKIVSCHEVLDWTKMCHGQDLVKLPILDWSWIDRFSNMGVSQHVGSMWHIRVVRNAASDKMILLIHGSFDHYLNIILWSMNYIYSSMSSRYSFISMFNAAKRSDTLGFLLQPIGRNVLGWSNSS